jgi:long-chain acyl-CoA synthetase
MTDQPWLNSYPNFVTPTVSLDGYQNIVEIFDESVSKFGPKVAYSNMGVTLTFREVDNYVDSLVYFLQHKTKLKKGDRIALQMPNLLQFPITIFACLKAGLVIVNTNPLYTAEEMRHQYKDSGAKAIIILENFASNLEKIITDTKIETVITTTIGDMLGGLKGAITNLVVRKVKKMVPAFQLDNPIPLKTILKENLGKKGSPVTLTPNDNAFLQYTGGTTGVSKGAQLSHGNLCANVQQVEGWIDEKFSEGQETIITALPMYHIFALTANCVVFFRYGAKNVLITNPRDMKAFCKDLRKKSFFNYHWCKYSIYWSTKPSCI